MKTLIFWKLLRLIYDTAALRRRARVMQPRWGWELFCGTITQGSPALRANPGLSDGIPLGFGQQHCNNCGAKVGGL